MAGKADSVRTILYALGANPAIGVAKTAAAITTGSSSMLAEAILSYADSALREFLQRRPEVEKVYKVLTLQLGATLMVAVRAKMNALTAVEVVAAINAAEGALRAEFPEIQWLFFEPDIAD